MKNYSQFKPFASAVLAVAILPLATLRAQVAYELAPSAFTLAMVIKETAPGTFERDPVGGAFITEGRQRIPASENDWTTGRVINGDILLPTSSNFEFVEKIVTTRYGNREIVAELIEKGAIEGPASGWSLVYVYGEDLESAVLTARKRGEEDVELDIIRLTYTGGANAGNFLATTSFRYNREGEETSAVATVRGRYNYEFAAFIDFGAVDEEEASLSGLEIGSGSLFSYYLDPTDRSDIEYFFVPGATRFTNLVGAEGAGEFDPSDPASLFTGTASIGASRVLRR